MVMENMIISSNKQMIGAITLHCGNFHLNLINLFFLTYKGWKYKHSGVDKFHK